MNDKITTLEAENQRLNVYVNQLEREVLALKMEKNGYEIQLHAHVKQWEKQTGFKFVGFTDCASLYQKEWEEDNKVVRIKK